MDGGRDERAGQASGGRVAGPAAQEATGESGASPAAALPVKRGRGRPPKAKPVDVSASASVQEVTAATAQPVQHNPAVQADPAEGAAGNAASAPAGTDNGTQPRAKRARRSAASAAAPATSPSPAAAPADAVPAQAGAGSSGAEQHGQPGGEGQANSEGSSAAPPAAATRAKRPRASKKAVPAPGQAPTQAQTGAVAGNVQGQAVDAEEAGQADTEAGESAAAEAPAASSSAVPVSPSNIRAAVAAMASDLCLDTPREVLATWDWPRLLALAMARYNATVAAKGASGEDASLPPEAAAYLQSIKGVAKTSGGSFKCPLCQVSKTTKAGIEYHVKKLVCVKNRAKGRGGANQDDSDEVRYVCPVCTRKFASQPGVKFHIHGGACMRGEDGDGDENEDGQAQDGAQAKPKSHKKKSRPSQAKSSTADAGEGEAPADVDMETGGAGAGDGDTDELASQAQANALAGAAARVAGLPAALSHLGPHSGHVITVPPGQLAELGFGQAVRMAALAEHDGTGASPEVQPSVASLIGKQGLPWRSGCSAVLPLGSTPVCALDVHVDDRPAVDMTCGMDVDEGAGAGAGAASSSEAAAASGSTASPSTCWIAAAVHPPSHPLFAPGSVLTGPNAIRLLRLTGQAREAWAVATQPPGAGASSSSSATATDEHRSLSCAHVADLLHSGGTAVDLVWCPHAAPGQDCIGLLAVAHGDGHLRLYAVPRQLGDATADAQPSRVFLVPVAGAACGKHRPLCLRWHPWRVGVLLAGCADGTILEFHLAAQQPDDAGCSAGAGASSAANAPGPGTTGNWMSRPASQCGSAMLGIPVKAMDTLGGPASSSTAAGPSSSSAAHDPPVLVLHPVASYASLHASTQAMGWGAARALSWHPADGRIFASAHMDGVLRLWDSRDPSSSQGPTADLAVCLRPLTGLDFAADGRSIFVAADTGEVREVSLPDGNTDVMFTAPDWESPPAAWDVRAVNLQMAAGPAQGEGKRAPQVPSTTLLAVACGDGYSGVLPVPDREERRGLLRTTATVRGLSHIRTLGLRQVAQAKAGRLPDFLLSPGQAAALAIDRGDCGLYASCLAPRQPPLNSWVVSRALEQAPAPGAASSAGARKGATAAAGTVYLPQQATLKVRMACATASHGAAAPFQPALWMACGTADGTVRVRLCDPVLDFGHNRWSNRIREALSAAVILRTAANKYASLGKAQLSALPLPATLPVPVPLPVVLVSSAAAADAAAAASAPAPTGDAASEAGSEATQDETAA